MRSFTRFLAVFILAGISTAAFPQDGKLPADVQARIDEAEARTAEAKARTELYKQENEAIKARLELLPKSPAKGDTKLDGSAGKLETELLVASTFRQAALLIANDPNVIAASDADRILVMPGKATLDRNLTMAFFAEAYGLESAFKYALPKPAFDCPEPDQVTSVALDPGTVGAVVSSLVDLLKTDITISAIDSSLDEQSLARAVAATQPARFTTTFRAGDLEQGRVSQTLCRLQNARLQSEVALRALGPKGAEEHPREFAAYSRANAAFDAFLSRLTTAASDKPPPLAQIMAESAIDDYPDGILRLWTDAKGGTVINRKSLWTMLGARSVGMTGGSVVSYLLTDKSSGDVIAAGMLHCNTRLVSLRTAHKDAFAQAYCEPATAK